MLSIVAEGLFEKATCAARTAALGLQEESMAFALHELRLVCKQFKNVVDGNPELATQLFLREYFPSTGVGSLVRWIDNHRSAVRTFFSVSESPVTEVALAAFVTASAGVEDIELHLVSEVSFGLLTAFKSLRRCALNRTFGQRDDSLDLSPLQALSQLQSLTLWEGAFGGLGSLAHLSSLDVSGNADCGMQCLFLHSLKSLTVHGSGELTGLGALGLSGCLNLQSLTCLGGRIVADVANHSLVLDTDAHVPVSLSRLTYLTYLHLGQCNGQQPDTISNTWIYNLMDLQNLTLGEVARDCVLSSMVTALTKLTRLLIRMSGAVESILDLRHVPWKHMHALHTLEVWHTERLHCDKELLGLLELQSLRSIRFCNVRPVDAESFEACGALLHQMASRRPGVKCVLGYGSDED